VFRLSRGLGEGFFGFGWGGLSGVRGKNTVLCFGVCGWLTPREAPPPPNPTPERHKKAHRQNTQKDESTTPKDRPVPAHPRDSRPPPTTSHRTRPRPPPARKLFFVLWLLGWAWGGFLVLGGGATTKPFFLCVVDVWVCGVGVC